MTPRKLNVFFGFPSYGGNGGIQSEVPDIRKWFAQTILWCKSDPRIGEIIEETIGDTPIPMVRNSFVLKARAAGADVLVMCDSDQHPDKHRTDPGFEPFFQSSFDFLYKHYDKGPVCIGAPYCGPPPGENVYVFHWSNTGYYGDETSISLEQYTRFEAARMHGIQQCAALPTGLIMYDMRCFEITEPSHLSKSEVLDAVLTGKMTKEEALRSLTEGWFYYEWKNGYAAEKASTEDVTETRDLSLAGIAKLGYNPVFCNWSSPIGHWKPWCVPGRPQMYGAENIAASFKRAIEQNFDRNYQQVELKSDLPSTVVHRMNGTPNGHAPKAEHKTPEEHLNALTRLAEEMQRKLGRRPIVIEIGSWHGDSAKAFVKGGASVTCVDTWEGSNTDHTGKLAKESPPYMKFLQNTAKERDEGLIDFIHSDSVTAAQNYPGPKADIIFIDADHSYEATKADIEAWLPHLAKNGVMVGHDYCTLQFPGVDKAVKEIFGDRFSEYAFDPRYGGFWLAKAEDIPHLLKEPVHGS